MVGQGSPNHATGDAESKTTSSQNSSEFEVSAAAGSRSTGDELGSHQDQGPSQPAAQTANNDPSESPGSIGARVGQEPEPEPVVAPAEDAVEPVLEPMLLIVEGIPAAAGNPDIASPLNGSLKGSKHIGFEEEEDSEEEV